MAAKKEIGNIDSNFPFAPAPSLPERVRGKKRPEKREK